MADGGRGPRADCGAVRGAGGGALRANHAAQQATAAGARLKGGGLGAGGSRARRGGSPAAARRRDGRRGDVDCGGGAGWGRAQPGRRTDGGRGGGDTDEAGRGGGASAGGGELAVLAEDAIESLRVRALSVQWGPLAHSTRILGHVGQLQRWEAVGGAALAPASSSFLRLCLGTDQARYYVG